ncbi:hypothetical protein PHISP_06809 [Aspergillus sp. HF37]|nr:hypothetical protein PHISP_06809 [Aspergillus sp. HF37]
MIPILPINKPNPQAYKADLSVATPSPDSATGAMAFSASFGYSDLATSSAPSLSSSTSSSTMPPPPPPSPINDMLDITPRKCSFSSLASSTARTNNTCAFPSWPNRPSLLNTSHSPPKDDSSTASAFLSDEDLYVPDAPDTPPAVDEESAARVPAAPVLTTEQQVQLLKAAAEEERCRARFMAQVKAHQALRLPHDPGFRPKRRSRSDKKRPRLGSNLGYRG